jgi:hypothetical protein
MRQVRSVLHLLAKSLLVLPLFGIAALVIALLSGWLQTESDGAMLGFTAFNAPGAGTTASMLQGTAAFSINTSGDIAGFETDSKGVHHGYLRSASGAFTEFDAAGIGVSPNQGTQPLSVDAAGDITGPYVDANYVYHGFVRDASGAITEFDAPAIGMNRGQGTVPVSIDADGDIAGFYSDTGGVLHAFLRTASSGSITTIDAPGAGSGHKQGTRGPEHRCDRWNHRVLHRLKQLLPRLCPCDRRDYYDLQCAQ